MVIDMRLLLIYKKLDALRNQKFIEYLQESAKKKNIDLNLVFYENLTFESIENVDGVINRTNEFDVSKHFETRGMNDAFSLVNGCCCSIKQIDNNNINVCNSYLLE